MIVQHEVIKTRKYTAYFHELIFVVAKLIVAVSSTDDQKGEDSALGCGFGGLGHSPNIIPRRHHSAYVQTSH